MTTTFGINFNDELALQDVAETICNSTGKFLVVTPNVDHVISYHENENYKEVVDDSDLVLCDSKVLRILSGFYGASKKVKNVVPGSDLISFMFNHRQENINGFHLVGGGLNDAEYLLDNFGVEINQLIPPYGLLLDKGLRKGVARELIDLKPIGVLLAVGSPQQEYLAKEIYNLGFEGPCLCIGASIDFLVGKQKRAPVIFRYFALEWLHRLLHSPRKMFHRYIIRGPKIFYLFFKYFFKGK